MKKSLKEWMLAIFIGLVIPWIVFSVMDKVCLKINTKQDISQTEAAISQAVETLPVNSERIPVLLEDGTVETMNLDDYLVGVVLGEMPVDFHEEALKAQSVVARTYALKRFTTGQKHPSGAVCTQSACCQAYRTPEEFVTSGGSYADLDRVSAAVKSTSGQVLYYEDMLIEATFFSCSGGRTEDALAVWGTDIPYLQAVDSPGEEAATYYTDSVKFSTEEFSKLLGVERRESSKKWFGAITYTDGGGVDQIEIANKVFQGTELRKLLGLRSTAFVITAAGDYIYITTRGFGHRVGMSQYGAEAMAVNGSDYRAILSHYYPGTDLRIYSDN